MTTKQKQNIARFKAVQIEAKKIKAKNKNLSHIEAVKEAWSKLKKGSKSIKGTQLDLFSTATKKAAKKKAAPKKAAKKVKVYQYGRTNILLDKQRQAKKPGKRTSSSGNTYYEYRANKSDAGRLLGTKTHKDTKSHNVNIRVVSGVVGKHFKTYKIYKKHIIDYEITPNKKKWYVVSGGFAKVPFYTDSLTIAKKYIDRLIAIEKSK